MKPAVTHGKVVQSCYQADMGKEGEIPGKRPIWYKTGMSSTTLDLFDGTAKDTYHVSNLRVARTGTRAKLGATVEPEPHHSARLKCSL